MNFLMVFDFTQFWLDGRPGNEYFWICHKISGHLTPMTPLGVHPQWFETTWNRYRRFLLLWLGNLVKLVFRSILLVKNWSFAKLLSLICLSFSFVRKKSWGNERISFSENPAPTSLTNYGMPVSFFVLLIVKLSWLSSHQTNWSLILCLVKTVLLGLK